MDSEVRVGGRLAGYRIESLLGRGGMSVVYLAEHVRLGRKVVLKVLPPELAADEVFRDRFVRESRIAAGLEHPNIVPIYEADEAGGHLFIAMRYVRGTDLHALIRTEGTLELGRTLAIVRQVASALDAAHAEGLVHRDVKPANILLGPGAGPEEAEHAYLSDFGITKRLAGMEQTTGTGQFMGSLDYVAPEQIEDRSVDHRADVYSLGCVLYHCLTGSPPYPRDTEVAVLWAHVRDKPPKVTAARPDMPPGLDDVIAKALAKPPERRYPSAGELAQAAVAEAGLEYRILTPPSTPTLQVRRKRAARLVWAGLLIALSAAAVTTVLTLGHGGGPVVGSTTETGSLNFKIGNVLERIDTGAVSETDGIKPADGVTMAVGEGAIWVATTDKVVEVQPPVPPASTIAVTPSAAAPSPTVSRLRTPYSVTVTKVPTQIVLGHGDIWVTGNSASGAGDLTKIDIGTFVTVWTHSLHQSADALTVSPEGVWVLSRSGTLVEVDIGHLKFKRLKVISVKAGAVDIAAGKKALWVVNDLTNTIRRVDPTTYVVSPPTALPGKPVAVAAGPEGVWVLDVDGTVVPVDSKTLAVGTPIPVGTGATGIVLGEGWVWVAHGNAVSKIDPVHLKVTGEITLGRPVLAIARGRFRASAIATRAMNQIWVLTAR